MIGKENQLRDFERYPKYKDAYIRAFQRMLDNHEEVITNNTWKCGQDVYDWWIESTNKDCLENQEEIEIKQEKEGL